jgi:hypothetical protein
VVQATADANHDEAAAVVSAIILQHDCAVVPRNWKIG